MDLRRFIYTTVAAAAILSMSTGCYDSHSMADNDTTLPAATLTVAELWRICSGGVMEVNRDVVLSCRVTTDDAAGNFYRTLFAEDTTGGIEIFAGIYDSGNKYPAGVAIALQLDGCAVAITDGVLQIGLPPQSYSTTAVDYFLSNVLLDRHIIRGSEVLPAEPLEIKCSDACDGLCGRLVRISGLYYVPVDVENDDGLCVGHRRFADDFGGEIYTTVSEYADFADTAIPKDTCAVCGILLYERITDVGWRYVVKPVDLNGYETNDNSAN